ncbi:hypothetical protein N8D55_03620 [Xanthomonas hortorum pv. pelargonii]|nr:hypothetical protein N8D55_03620 [Xanthomonas hortorum pv. pelargonii]
MRGVSIDDADIPKAVCGAVGNQFKASFQLTQCSRRISRLDFRQVTLLLGGTQALCHLLEKQGGTVARPLRGAPCNVASIALVNASTL